MRRALLLTIAVLGFSTGAAALIPSGAAALIPSGAAAADASVAPRLRSASATDPVVAWNQFLLDLQSTPGAQPASVHPTYELAIVHAAIYDAVVSIDRSAAPFRTRVHGSRRASASAAADAAAHDTLVALYPGQRQTIDARYASMLAELAPGSRRSMGIRIGRRVAAQLLASRVGDGAAAPPLPFTPGSAAGDYQLTPPAFAAPVFTQWRFVRPFTLRRASQFRPLPPASLTSSKYAAAINEVKALGAAEGSTRTPDQTQIGLFWNPPIWTAWNRIAQSAALGNRDNLARSARTFAALNLTFADAVIAFYDAKYTYRFWRPLTAIRGADTDGNPETVADPGWTPLSNTAPDPSYPGAHGTISAAGADVLAAIYGNDFPFTVTSPALPGVERSFVSFSEAAQEASASRIFNGNHTRLDEVAGEDLGHDVARFLLAHDLLPAHARPR